MSATSFSPYAIATGARERGCLTCEHFKGAYFGAHVVCEQRAKPQVIGRPELGCAYWMRAIGSDD